MEFLKSLWTNRDDGMDGRNKGDGLTAQCGHNDGKRLTPLEVIVGEIVKVGSVVHTLNLHCNRCWSLPVAVAHE